MKPKNKLENALAKIAGNADAKSGKIQNRILLWLEQIGKRLGTPINPTENVIDIFIERKNGNMYGLIAPGPTTYKELKEKIGDTAIIDVFANVYQTRGYGPAHYDLIAERATVVAVNDNPQYYKIFGGSYGCSGVPVVPQFKSVQIQIYNDPATAASITVNNSTVSTSSN